MRAWKIGMGGGARERGLGYWRTDVGGGGREKVGRVERGERK